MNGLASEEKTSGQSGDPPAAAPAPSPAMESGALGADPELYLYMHRQTDNPQMRAVLDRKIDELTEEAVASCGDQPELCRLAQLTNLTRAQQEDAVQQLCSTVQEGMQLVVADTGERPTAATWHRNKELRTTKALRKGTTSANPVYVRMLYGNKLPEVGVSPEALRLMSACVEPSAKHERLLKEIMPVAFGKEHLATTMRVARIAMQFAYAKNLEDGLYDMVPFPGCFANHAPFAHGDHPGCSAGMNMASDMMFLLRDAEKGAPVTVCYWMLTAMSMSQHPTIPIGEGEREILEGKLSRLHKRVCELVSAVSGAGGAGGHSVDADLERQFLEDVRRISGEPLRAEANHWVPQCIVGRLRDLNNEGGDDATQLLQDIMDDDKFPELSALCAPVIRTLINGQEAEYIAQTQGLIKHKVAALRKLLELVKQLQPRFPADSIIASLDEIKKISEHARTVEDIDVATKCVRKIRKKVMLSIQAGPALATAPTVR
ncbi:MAG: hypothetical protein CL450_04255 [Acidimicrobiaceae bacterium]|nr:hypothetical protein [Acidimicrobiaceae bacterium]